MCKYSRVNQSVVHHVCSVSSESDGIQTVGLTEEHKPLRFTRAHSHASRQIENGLGWQAFVLSFGLFVSCTCIFIMYLFLLQHNSLFISHIVLFSPFSWNEAICHKYAHTVYRAYCNAYAGLYAKREEVSQFLSNIFVNMLQPGVCWMNLVTNILFNSRIAEQFTVVLFWFMLHSTKNVTCDKEREMHWGEFMGWSLNSRETL